MGFSFADIIKWWWHGCWQAILLRVPLLKPDREGNKAPAWFRFWYASWVWTAYLDSDRRPTELWLEFYFFAIRGTFERWLEDLKGRAVSESLYWVAGWTGKPKHGYYTLEAWLDAVWTRATSTLPAWISDLGLEIAAVYHNLRAWAEARYDALLPKVATLWTWLQGTGSLLSAFYDDTHTWIANFKLNPSGVILGVLGGTWARLVSFDQGPLAYFFNLWGSYRQTLADFLSDPLGWIYDQAEDFLLSKW